MLNLWPIEQVLGQRERGMAEHHPSRLVRRQGIRIQDLGEVRAGAHDVGSGAAERRHCWRQCFLEAREAVERRASECVHEAGVPLRRVGGEELALRGSCVGGCRCVPSQEL